MKKNEKFLKEQVMSKAIFIVIFLWVIGAVIGFEEIISTDTLVDISQVQN